MEDFGPFLSHINHKIFDDFLDANVEAQVMLTTLYIYDTIKLIETKM
jgi:hypothetical protein